MSIINHDEAIRDRAAMLAMRAMIAVSGSFSIEPGARDDYDQLIARTKIAAIIDPMIAPSQRPSFSQTIPFGLCSLVGTITCRVVLLNWPWRPPVLANETG